MLLHSKNKTNLYRQFGKTIGVSNIGTKMGGLIIGGALITCLSTSAFAQHSLPPSQQVPSQQVPAPIYGHNEEHAWENAKKGGRIIDYGLFVKQYPNSKDAHHAEEFALASLHRQNNSAAYANFVSYFPNANLDSYTGPRVNHNEDHDWEAAKSSGLIADFGRFVWQYPNSQYAHHAEEFALASLHRQNTHGAYETFVKYFPNTSLAAYTGPRGH